MNYRGEALSGQIGVRKGRRKRSGLTGRHRVDQTCVWETTDKSELSILALIAEWVSGKRWGKGGRWGQILKALAFTISNLKIILKDVWTFVDPIEGSDMVKFLFYKKNKLWRMDWNGTIPESGQLIGGCGICLWSAYEGFIRKWQWEWRRWDNFQGYRIYRTW